MDEPGPSDNEAKRRKEAKQRKKERKRLKEARQPLSAQERLRHQWDVLDLERRLMEDLDRSVRYALIVHGVTNTAAVLIATRSSLFVTMAPAALVILKILSAAYAVVAFATLAYAIRSFRPKLTLETMAGMRALAGGAAVRPLLVILPSAAPIPMPAELDAAWERTSREELSRELTIATLASKAASDRKHATLKRLYTGLWLMLLLGALMIATLGLESAW